MRCIITGKIRQASYDSDWLAGFIEAYGRGAQFVGWKAPEPKDWRSADLIVVLHSATSKGIDLPDWLDGDRRGKMLLLTGNDYKDFPEKQAVIDRLHPDLVGTCAPNTPYTGVRQIHIPHALNPHRFKPGKPWALRPIDIGFRGHPYPPGIQDGRHRLIEMCFSVPNVAVDVQYAVFNHPDLYADWLPRCRVTPATEAGLHGMEAVSSRHFDAIGCKTAIIGYAGHYSGCLDDRHYFKVADDLSDFAEVLGRALDPGEWASVTEAAYQHVMANHTYRHRIADIERLLWETADHAATGT